MNDRCEFPAITEKAVEARWYLRPREVSRLTGLSESEIYRSIYAGSLPALRYRSRVWLIRRGDVERWISEETERATA